jgi:hypothetical protein
MERQMFSVEASYYTRLGNLRTVMTTCIAVATRDEAEELRAAIKAIPELDEVTVLVRNAPPPTVDEAMQAFRRRLAEYPVDTRPPAKAQPMEKK